MTDIATLLDQLAELSRQIESHRCAIHMLEIERMELQTKLRRTGWRPPKIEVAEGVAA